MPGTPLKPLMSVSVYTAGKKGGGSVPASSAGSENAWNTGDFIIGSTYSERSQVDQKRTPGLETLDPYRLRFYFGDEISLQLVFIGMDICCITIEVHGSRDWIV